MVTRTTSAQVLLGRGQRWAGRWNYQLGAQEGAMGDGVQAVHPPHVVPADVAAHKVSVLIVDDTFKSAVGPILVAGDDLLAPGERAEFDQESADVVSRSCLGEGIECLVADDLGDGQLGEELRDVAAGCTGECTASE